MKGLFIAIFILLSVAIIAQPALSFQRCYGGTGTETANKMFDCNGNGFIVVGETSSNDGDVSGNHGGKDIWVFRSDSTGNIVWQKCFGGSADEALTNVNPTNDGGYLISTITSSNDGDVSGNSGGTDFWVFKIDSVGNLLWQNSIGGSGDEPYSAGWSIYWTGFNVSTQSLDLYFCSISTDGEMSTSLGMQDIWNVTIESSGNTIIQNSNSTTGEDELMDVWIMNGNITLVCIISSYLRVGQTNFPMVIGYSNWGGRTTDGGYLVYWEDYWGQVPYSVEKYDSTGAYQGNFGCSSLWCGASYTTGYTYMTNTGFVVHYEIDYVGCFNPNPPAYYTYTTEYSNSGTTITGCTTEQLTFGGWPTGNITTYGVCPSGQGGGVYYPPSDTALEGGLIRFSGYNDILAEKNTFSHNLEWTKSLGGTGWDSYSDYIQRLDTSYWILGNTSSNDGDVTGNHGAQDLWLTHLSPAKNWISGYVWEDVNANSMIDAGDLPVSNLLLQAQTSPGNVAYDITEANGKYELNVGIGNLVISAPNLPLYHTLLPATDTVSFSNNNASIDSLHNFLMVEIPNMQDLRITLTALSTPLTSMDRAYDLTYKNVGTQASNATIRYVFDGNETFTSASPAPDTLTATYASWNVNNIIPSQIGSVSLVTHINPSATGLTITSTAMVYPFANDQYLTDNTEELQAIATTLNVGLPYDPNDKLVSPVGNPTLSTFLANEKYLTYTIRFQNTGTAPATKVVLKDTLSLLLDITTLEILSASHDFVASIEGSNKLVITYNNIMLPDSSVDYIGSQGFIKFRIKPKSPVGYCQAIVNKSSIYFDFNTPVMTNEVSIFFLPDAPTITSVMNPLCEGTDEFISGTHPATGFQNMWTSTGGNFNSIANDTAHFHANIAGTHQIVLTQNIANIAGCTVSSPPVNVLIHPLPSVTFTNMQNYTLCQGNNYLITASLDTNYTYNWYDSNTFTGVTTNSYPVTQTGHYHVKIYTSYGCMTDFGTAFVTVNPSPTVTSAMAIGNTDFCIGDSVLLIATASPAGCTFQWQKNGSIAPNGANDSVYVKLNGNYRVIAKNSYNCRDTSVIIPVTVHPLPTINLTNVGALTFCDGNSVTLNATNTAGYNYVWNESGNPIIGVNSNSYQATQSGTYTVTVVDSNGCTKTSLAKTVVVNPKPTVSAFAMGDTSLCQGDTLLLTANATAGVTFQWKKNVSYVPNGANDSLRVTTTGNYSVVVSNSSNCKDTSEIITVNVHTLPATPTITQNGAALTSSSASFYQWYLNGVAIAGATSQSYIATQNGTYYVIVANIFGCEKQSLNKVLSTVGIETGLGEGFISIYPNPAQEVVFVTWESELNTDARVSLTDAAGKEVFSINITQKPKTEVMVPVAALAEGVYLVRVEANEAVYTEKVIVKR